MTEAERQPSGGPGAGSRRPLAPHEVLQYLQVIYGPLRWTPRQEPVAELVLTILSQHTSDMNARRAFERLRERFPSWEALMAAPEAAIEECIRTAGLSRQKAPRIKAVLERIKELRGDLDLGFLKQLPLAEAKQWLRALPGVGPKTAAVVLCFSLGMPAMPVDTHVYRVAKRLGLVGPKVTVEQAHDVLEKGVTPEQVFPFHMYLITHGRQVCKAQRPLCGQCVLSARCPSSRV